MRIVHVSTLKSHPCFSRTVLLQARTHEVFFIKLNLCGSFSQKTDAVDQKNGVTYMYLNVREDRDFAANPGLEEKLSQIFRRLKPDVIHVQLFSGLNALSVLRAAGAAGIPSRKIITLHDHSLFCLSGTVFDQGGVCLLRSFEECACSSCLSVAQRKGLSVFEYNRLRKKRCQEMAALADVIICCSIWQRDVLARLSGEREKTAVLYYGVEFSGKKQGAVLGRAWEKFFRGLAGVGSGWQQRVEDGFFLPSFGYLGSLWGLKGIETILDAAEQIRPFKFRIVMGITSGPSGSGNDALLKRITDHPRIRVVKDVGREDLYAKFFSQIDYMIIPSVWQETDPMTLFEAFFYKVPVILADRSSMTEKTTPGINAFVFEDAASLAEILRSILENRILKPVRRRKNFPVKTSKEYTRILENLYQGESDLPVEIC